MGYTQQLIQLSTNDEAWMMQMQEITDGFWD
jgi:hypothetical protein